MIRIEIDGKPVEVDEGSMVIEAADALGVPVPRFCYHHKLSIAANCRMCLVEVERAPKPLPACATPVSEGMKVWTKSKKTIEAQQAVMEFLLINHPLDCPICDQGGECELQDVAFSYGKDVSCFSEGKRVVADQNLGSLIATDMTRCIHCTRCVRFGTEIAGLRELGATGRGEHVEIGTYIEHSINSELSGNVIDLCPVGALTSKPYRFKARSWELQARKSIAPHDCLGSNILIHHRGNDIMRVVPGQHEAINEVWISDRDRFSYEALQHEERLNYPLIKKDGQWVATSWDVALAQAVATLKALSTKENDFNIGALISPNATTEECYLTQKFIRGLGACHIDHRLRQVDFRNQDMAPLFPNLGLALEEISQLDSMVLVGSWLHKEVPLLVPRLRKLVANGGHVSVINPMRWQMRFDVNCELIPEKGDILSALARLLKAVLLKTNRTGPTGFADLLKEIEPSAIEKDLADKILQTEKRAILLGHIALSHPDASRIIALANVIAQLTSAKFGTVSDGANASGAWLTGCVPHRKPAGKTVSDIGKHVKQMLTEPCEGYLLVQVDPVGDCVYGTQMQSMLKKAQQVVAITAYKTKSLLESANILLPCALFSENEGTLVNALGHFQSFHASIPLQREAKPAWKILKVLGELAGLNGFAYNNIHDVQHAIHLDVGEKHPLNSWQVWCPHDLGSHTTSEGLTRISPTSLYDVDMITRRAKSLQATQDARLARTIWLNPNKAKVLSIKEGELVVARSHNQSIKLPVHFDEQVPEDCVCIFQSIEETANFGTPYTTVMVEKG